MQHKDAISRGYGRGMYASAYETSSVLAMLRGIQDESAEYRAAAVLGFLACYERGEMTLEERQAYDHAFARVGLACERAGSLESENDRPVLTASRG